MDSFTSKKFYHFIHIIFFLSFFITAFSQDKCQNAEKYINELSSQFGVNEFSSIQGKIETKEKIILEFIRGDENINPKELCHEKVIEIVYYLSLIELYRGFHFKIPERVKKFREFIKNSNQIGESTKPKYQEKMSTLLGEYHYELKDYQKAKEEYLKSYQLAINKDSISLTRKAICHINLGHAIALSATELDSLEKVEKLFEKANSILIEIKKDSLFEAYERINTYASLYKARVNMRKFELGKVKNNKLLISAFNFIDKLEDNYTNDRLSLMIPHYKAEIKVLQGDKNSLNKAKKILDESIAKIWDLQGTINRELIKYYGNHIEDLLKVAIKCERQSTAKKILESFLEVQRTDKSNTNKDISLIYVEKKNLQDELVSSGKEKEELTDDKNNLTSLILNLWYGLIFLGLFVIGLIIVGSYKVLNLRKMRNTLETEKLGIQKQKEETLKQKIKLEEEIGSVKKNKADADRQRAFLEILHKNSGSLTSFIDDENKNLNFGEFMIEAIEKTYKIAEGLLKFDTIGIGIYEKENEQIKMYAKEHRRGKLVLYPSEPFDYNLKNDRNNLPVYIFKNGNTPRFIENNFINGGYKKYGFESLPKSKDGEHSSSIMYVKIGESGVITVQSLKQNQYEDEHWELLKTMGENIFNAIRNMKAIIELKNQKRRLVNLQRDTSHRVKNHIADLSDRINLQLFDDSIQGNKVAREALLNVKIKTDSISIIHQMIHHKWDNKEKQVKISVFEYFKKLVERLFKDSFGLKNHEFEINIEPLKNVSDLRISILKDLGAIVTELSLNIFKHAYNDPKDYWIGFDTKVENSSLILVLSDKGKGLKNIKYKKNMGFDLLDDFLDGLDGEMDIDYYQKEKKIGTKFIIKIPLKIKNESIIL